VAGEGDITGKLATVTLGRVMPWRTTSAIWVACGLLVACSQVGGRSAATTSAPTAVTVSMVSASELMTDPTGVQGLDDPDAFCAAWAAYAGSLQAIAVAQGFGDLSTLEGARLEMIAASSLGSAVNGIGANWPAELNPERSLALTALIGPYDRRAQKARELLREMGATDDDLEALADVWMRAMRTQDPNDPVPAISGLSPRLEDIVSRAAMKFDAQVTPFQLDPSLDVSAVATPLTDVYLADHCPDLASSGVGDQL